IDSGILMLEAFIDGLVQTMPSINNAIVTKIIPALFNALLTAIPMMNRAGTQLITSLVSSLWNTWRDKSASNLNRIKNAITNFFRNAGQWLRDAGRQLIDGLIGGITSKFNDVRNALSNLTSSLPSWKGPAHVDRLILRDAGRQVIEGFQAGINDQVGSVKRQLQGITADIGSITVQGSPHAPASSSVTVTLAPGAIVINGHGTDAGRQAAEALIEHLGQAVLVRCRMVTITTLRPSATQSGVGWVAQPTGALHEVTADDLDTTYALWSGDGSALILAVPSSSPPPGEWRHQVR